MTPREQSYEQYLRELRIRKLEARVVDNRESVRWPERWTKREGQ